MKVCSKCNVGKPVSEYHTQHGKPRPECKQCRSEYRRASYRRNKAREDANNREVALRLKYGIDSREYNAMLERQGGCCAICNTKPTSKRLAVDHCHTTGAVRGLLCDRCNRGLGYFKDSIASLKAAADYLRRTK